MRDDVIPDIQQKEISVDFTMEEMKLNFAGNEYQADLHIFANCEVTREDSYGTISFVDILDISIEATIYDTDGDPLTHIRTVRAGNLLQGDMDKIIESIKKEAKAYF